MTFWTRYYQNLDYSILVKSVIISDIQRTCQATFPVKILIRKKMAQIFWIVSLSNWKYSIYNKIKSFILNFLARGNRNIFTRKNWWAIKIFVKLISDLRVFFFFRTGSLNGPSQFCELEWWIGLGRCIPCNIYLNIALKSKKLGVLRRNCDT